MAKLGLTVSFLQSKELAFKLQLEDCRHTAGKYGTSQAWWSRGQRAVLQQACVPCALSCVAHRCNSQVLNAECGDAMQHWKAGCNSLECTPALHTPNLTHELTTTFH